MNSENSLPRKNYIVGYVDNSSFEIPYMIIVTNPADYNSLFKKYMPPMPVFNRYTRFFIVPATEQWKDLLKDKQYDFQNNKNFFSDTTGYIWEPDFSHFLPYAIDYEVQDKVYEVQSFLDVNLHEDINMKQILSGRKFYFPHKDVNRSLYTSGEFSYLPMFSTDTKIEIN